MWEKKRHLKRRYDLTSDTYDSRYEEIQRKKIRAVLKELGDPKRLLDVGCGTGLFIDAISNRAEKVVGIDFSFDMLERAKKRSGDAMLVSADADNLPFPDNCFDTVVSLTLLQNMPRPERTVLEMGRVTEREGRVIVTVLEKKISADEVESWLSAANIYPVLKKRIPKSEDSLCVGNKK